MLRRPFRGKQTNRKLGPKQTSTAVCLQASLTSLFLLVGHPLCPAVPARLAGQAILHDAGRARQDRLPPGTELTPDHLPLHFVCDPCRQVGGQRVCVNGNNDIFTDSKGPPECCVCDCAAYND